MLMPLDDDLHSRERKRRTLEGVTVTVTAIAVWFSDSNIEKAPCGDYVLLREHIYTVYTTEVS